VQEQPLERGEIGVQPTGTEHHQKREQGQSAIQPAGNEEIHASTYCDFEDLQERVEEFIERYYNRCRLHSALGYCSPDKFEEEAQAESWEGVCSRGNNLFC